MFFKTNIVLYLGIRLLCQWGAWTLGKKRHIITKYIGYYFFRLQAPGETNRSWGRKSVSPPSIRWGCFHPLSPQLQLLTPRASRLLEEREAKYILHASPFTPSCKLWLKWALQPLHLMFYVVKCLINMLPALIWLLLSPQKWLHTCNYLYNRRYLWQTGDLKKTDWLVICDDSEYQQVWVI